MMFNDEARMREKVSMDPDLPAVERWVYLAMMFPDAADFLIKKYCPKATQKAMKRLLMKEKTHG